MRESKLTIRCDRCNKIMPADEFSSPRDAVVLDGRIVFTRDHRVRQILDKEWCSWLCFVNDLIEILKEEKIDKTKTKD